ncbi:MAG: hypothetical protein SO168_01440 [Muribaculaceae bacterium]|nr:hypothetical protein [Muribaculaceae bacterium]
MKIFRVNRRVGEWPREAEEALRTPYGAPLRALDVNVLADSAANRNNRPMFVPDFAREGWVVEVLPAVRIGRLGKFIAPRFAHRYIQDILLTAFLHQPDGDPVAPLACLFDGALTLGDPIPNSAFCNPHSSEASSADAAAIYRAPTTGTLHIEASLAPLSHGAASPASDAAPISRGAAADAATIIADVDIEALRLPETIALLSRYCTLKSGDLILPASAAITFPALLNHQLTAACTAPSCTASATTAAPCLMTRLK